MASVTTSAISTLTSRRGPLRIYEWLWLVICTLGALLVAAPRILSQPIRYEAAAATTIDVAQRYRELYTNGSPDDDFRAVEVQALELLKARHPDLGAPTFSVRFAAQHDGRIDVIALGRTPTEAQQLADEAAEALARHVRAAGGREILRNLLGWELVVALQGRPPDTPFQLLLREIIRTSAFPLNRAVEPVSADITVDQLPAEELSDLTRALEVREEQISRIELPALQLRRNRTLPGDAAALDSEIQRMIGASRTVRDALTYLYSAHEARFAVDRTSDAYRSSRAALPTVPIDRRIPLLLAVAVVVGMLFGGAGIVIDRSAGVMRKIRELWGYRELIRNLVLRDMRVRYKGSALGYLWTQLAPLLLMLVFWLVFSIFLPSGIAMFPVFLIVGLLPWNYCAEAVSSGARSVIENAPLVKKVFFPREVLPLTAVLSSLLNFMLSLPMLLLVMAVGQAIYPPLRESGRISNLSWTIAYLPVLLIIQTIFLAGMALFLAALAVFFRDAVHLIGILIQLWFFLTPVVYSLDAIGGAAAQAVRWLNPMASLVDFYREILYGNTVPSGLVPTPGLPGLDSVLRVLLTSLIVLAFGYWFFQRRSGEFGERL
ncbi:MAG TPA: ABC transporter permease [Roseiflexaceae bacterium]|nr:ABC transporter permease [Roseiflexaceae bacterium]